MTGGDGPDYYGGIGRARDQEGASQEVEVEEGVHEVGVAGVAEAWGKGGGGPGPDGFVPAAGEESLVIGAGCGEGEDKAGKWACRTTVDVCGLGWLLIEGVISIRGCSVW